MLTNFDETIIPYYSPISSRGGRRKSRKNRTRKYKRSKKLRTRRRYH